MRNTPTRKVVQLSTGRDVDELLRELYVDQNRTLEEIGKALGVSRETVRQWILDAGIKRPDRAPLDPLVAA
jgi:DNA-directed RNA polymerase sigma subunit (sigma70/sigma32)